MAKNTAVEVVDKDLTQIEEIKKGVGDLVIRMAAVKSLKTQADYESAVILGKEGAQSIENLEEAEVIAMAPYKPILVKAEKIETAVKAIKKSIKIASDSLREICKKYLREEDEKKQKKLAELAEKKRQEEAAIAQANTATEQVKAVAKVEKTEIKIEMVMASKPDNSSTFRKVEVIDEALVPREYLSVDMTKLNTVKGKVGTPIPEIPGVRIYDDKQVKF